ncbi:MAG: porin family protein [Elusimicrobium sp.]|jgi:opacity protein-like surface antigen|nr:porin family protein [Elusimicrobium sp.]
MKKLLAGVFIFMAAAAYAGIDYGLEAGQTRIGVYGGMSVPQDWDWTAGGVSPGRTGPMFGAELVRNIVPPLSIGIDINYASYGKESSAAAAVNSRVFGGHVTGRLNLFPEMPTRIYIPVAAGISDFQSNTDGAGSAGETGFSFFTGAGVEFDLGPEWTLGLEGRYFYMPIDRDKFGDDKFTSISLLLKLGARF